MLVDGILRQVLSVDANSSLTKPSYLVRFLETGLWLTTEDVVAANSPLVEHTPVVESEEIPGRPSLLFGKEPRRW